MHGRVNIVLTTPNDSRLCQSRIAALNCLRNAWKKAIMDDDNERKQSLMSCVLMAMPYWPSEDRFPFDKNEGALRNLLKKNEKYLAKSLLDYLNLNPEARPDEILANNQEDFKKRPQYQLMQPWRRDWQNNLLLWEKKNENNNYIFGKRVQYYMRSDSFYLYQTGNIKGAIPLNDYRFDFICNDNDTMKKALEVFYKSVGVNRPEEMEMTMNDLETRSTVVKLQNGDRRLYFYHDHVPISFYHEEKDGNGSWSSQQTVAFKDNNGKSIFAQEELASRVTEFFNTITEALQKS